MAKLKKTNTKDRTSSRDKFNEYKNMLLPLVLESAEVLKHFKLKSQKKVAKAGRFMKSNKDEIGEGLADVLYWVLMVSHDLGIDLKKSFDAKMEKNSGKFPIESKGK
ncbi:MAG: hypothetical protein A3B99_05135 [Candidatus Yanofskybacteria bacterium RIFCSPHIGHO2_02_FULL_44_12b]|uniref:MazG nucleotide pyrophosphohydrolase n=2 Tax=Candidatus Yanofskyibacteriota TaxID=1752733 RepID=A0A0G1NAM3_9BACT|nr:MAG: MazG nucleotide pyrophosphohydrolase [Candidatus Yanofskybacteria bacterium GW2011_GWA2_44_9]OGN04264.1 MAG: hypothetical protein A2659_03190 [Candidatus Yanofskybacteria bacterium RIFCSPHIGHO2_01_FULL_44_24]OGN14370.1 MAG: hypothetical protein A3B99_05135 [Candidatus Yanofskybacteria bacterium RIFCSPHIGHO2_02_FULL_44_12b]OGN25371.1 MAG: hypothetical protein A2925_00700 [Candidatus Yanofskybacteria bacterium RIFCSPLOWO2_01_FULL_44_22]